MHPLGPSRIPACLGNEQAGRWKIDQNYPLDWEKKLKVSAPRRRVLVPPRHTLRCGSSTSLSQSPRMLKEMTVARMAIPGMEVIHQAVER